VVAQKEFGDHVSSIRLLVLLAILAVAVVAPLYFVQGRLRDAPQQVGDVPALLVALFTFGPAEFPVLSVSFLLAILAPILGLAFGFDSVNVERLERTLPRLVAQPIHRDDVINGKFVAGISAIGLVLGALITFVAAIAVLRLGIHPNLTEVVRLVVWFLFTLVYVGFWLALATLLSVVTRSPATALFVGFGAWLLSLGWTLFAGTVLSLLVAPPTDIDSAISFAQFANLVERLSPATLYREGTIVMLRPDLGAADVTIPGSAAQFAQAQQQISSVHTLDQSLLLIWPQLVVLIALTVIVFALSYVLFMRQEVRA
jgi:ABC-2 type transport system permease protein